ncbi:hypothetical protein [Alienimonas sp. DA493]|uniref:hypothetical protein n=1 Tax=Alienimonas sp. DA493 TaxID=3373605 RepID=UPI0037542436
MKVICCSEGESDLWHPKRLLQTLQRECGWVKRLSVTKACPLRATAIEVYSVLNYKYGHADYQKGRRVRRDMSIRALCERARLGETALRNALRQLVDLDLVVALTDGRGRRSWQRGDDWPDWVRLSDKGNELFHVYVPSDFEAECERNEWRVYLWLLHLGQKHHTTTPEFFQRGIATSLGLSRRGVIDALGRLERRRLIERHGSRYTLLPARMATPQDVGVVPEPTSKPKPKPKPKTEPQPSRTTSSTADWMIRQLGDDYLDQVARIEAVRSDLTRLPGVAGLNDWAKLTAEIVNDIKHQRNDKTRRLRAECVAHVMERTTAKTGPELLQAVMDMWRDSAYGRHSFESVRTTEHGGS